MGFFLVDESKEFAKLSDDANIYKSVGPVLLKQDKNEAVMAVNGRLEFIEKEMWVHYSFSQTRNQQLEA